jgi:hypothetical protein
VTAGRLTSRGRALALLLLCGAAVLAAPPARAQQLDLSPYYDPGSSGFELRLYCNEAAVSSPETLDTITATAWHGDTLLGQAAQIEVVCSRWYDPNRENAFYFLGTYEQPPTHFVVETDGSDAFFADWIEIHQYSGYDQYGGNPAQVRKIGQWGAPGGRGYCLSRDPGDLSGDWAGASDACDAAIRVDVPRDAIYAAQPTNLARWSIGLDCTHSGLTRTIPFAVLSTSVEDGQGQEIAHQRKEPETYRALPDVSVEVFYDEVLKCLVDEAQFHLPYDQPHGLEPFVARDVAGITFAVGELLYDWRSSDRGNARLYIDQLVLLKNGRQFARWGGNEGRGWCLSRYAENWIGLWAVHAVEGCFPRVRFDVATETWSLP